MDLDAIIRALVQAGVSRPELIKKLDSIATDAEKRARRFQRQKMDDRATRERQLVDRIGRVLFFLHHSLQANRATEPTTGFMIS
jgi:hypothetical protein